jgi:hypothetical protein
MRRTRAPHTHCRLERGEPEVGGEGLRDAWGQHGRDPTRCQPGFAPCSLALGLLGGTQPDKQWDVDKTVLGDDDYIAKNSSVTVAETTCGYLQSSPSLRLPSRQGMDVPYDTMVSYTGDVEHPSKRPVLTRAGEESAYIYMAVLLLRQSFNSVQRRWMPKMWVCTLLEVHPHEGAPQVKSTAA